MQDFEINSYEISEELSVFGDEVENDKDSILKLIKEGKFRDFKNAIIAFEPADIAEIFSSLPKDKLIPFFRLLPKDTAAEVFVEMDAEEQISLVNSFNDKELSDVLAELYLDDTVDIIEEMPANLVKRILRASSKEDRTAINHLLRYPKDSAGAIMTTEYVRFTPEMTVSEALSHIRRVAIDKETIYTSYVTDKDKRLLGIVSAKTLLTSELSAPLSSVMEENVIYVGTGDDKENVAYMLEKYGFLAIPVVDMEKRLVGIVTHDDAMAVMSEAAEEDFAKMAAITPTEAPYLKSSIFETFKARIPWLLLLMISSSIASAILSRFEAAFPAVLLLFAPMLMGTGGNAGGQSSVTITRGISLGELSFKNLPKVLYKELRISFLVGATLGVMAFLKLMFLDRFIMQNPDVTVAVAAVVSSSLVLIVVASKLVGSTLPLLAKKVGLDPAVMASPVIATIVDVISLILYFFVSQFLLNII